MNPHLDSKSNVCPKSCFSFVLPFLFFKWNPLTAMCINLPFYQYSWIFAAINMMVNLALNSYFLFWHLAAPPPQDNVFVQSIDVGRFHLSIRIPWNFLHVARMVYSVQGLARGLYFLLVADNYGPLLGSVVTGPALFAFDMVMSARNFRKEDCGCPGGCRQYFWMRTVKHVTAVLHWSTMCCLLFGRFEGCVREE
ncbi:uncharacterized protein LOC120426335 [Culex pipiens pallens]|uniref:uncharacterized protein LOC120426335 n=1 Tax=Culex pipiens pallens TaxID=42434 RepID=UPI001953403B|nr:uncharacterized protein LOC120426335 [Culex pipiens pallens]